MKAPMDIWFRNANKNMSVCAEEGVARLTWTRQHLGRLKMDGILFVRQFYMHTPIRPKIMLIGVQGTSEYNIFSKYDEPVAVYPTWAGKEDSWDELLNMIESPWGEDARRCTDMRTPASIRPVWGQKHRVVIHNCPAPISGVGQQFWAQLSRVQDDYPNVELFINGTGSYATLFGLKFKAGDFGINDLGDNINHLYLPNGMKIKLDKGELHKMIQWEDWIKLLGFSINELVENTNSARYRMRIRSIRWAAKHWANNYRFHKDRYNIAVDTDSSDFDYDPPSSRSIVLRRKEFTTKDADKVLCNRCRIAPGCKLYRQDAICGLKDSEMGDLEKFFQSRNAGLIIDGLAKITQLQAQRLDSALDKEANEKELDPQVGKEINALFANGVKLAQLVNPDLKGGPKVQVNVGVNGGNAEIVSMTNPKELIGNIVMELERRGIPRDQQTPDMIEGVLKGMTVNSQPQAIEAQAIKAEDIIGKKDDQNIIDIEPVKVARTARDAE